MKVSKIKGINGITVAIVVALFAISLMIFQYFYIGIFLKKQANTNSKEIASFTAKEVSQSIEVYFRDALTVTRTYAENFMVYKHNAIPRTTIYKLMRASLSLNDKFIAIWTMWEPNAYDNNDERYKNDTIHDPRGSFAIAYYYDKKDIKQEINDTLDFLEDFYTIPKKLKKPVILDPYYYQYHGNEKVYFETSLISPVIEKNEFLGVIGIDIDMYELQQKYRNKVVFEDGFICILSNSGQIVSHKDSVYINKNISGFITDTTESILDSLKAAKFFMSETYSVFSNEKVIRYYYPINIDYMASPWYIMVEIPQRKVLEKVNSLNKVSLILLISSLLLLVYLIYNIIDRRMKEKELLKHKNHLEVIVKERTDELATSNEELKMRNEELLTQHEVLEKTLENLKTAQDQMVQSEKMASLGLLAAGIAHEINNPLNFIQGSITAIESYINQNMNDHLSSISPLLDGIQIGVDRAAAIITSLNQYSRQDKQLREACNIHSIIDNCLVMLQNQIKDKIIVVKNYTNIEHKLICNESKMHQVFINILVNAIHAIENKGTITIHTIIAGPEMIIKIQDNGYGIRGEDLPKIFDPFFTTKEPGKGTGLGLSITYNILKEHGGKIQFKSSIGKGTEVEICMPLHE